MSKVTGNAKVAKARGTKWRKSLIKGRLEAQFNPTEVQLKRTGKQLSQAEIAKKVGVSTATFGSIERGKRKVSEDRAKKIAGLVGTSLPKIFRDAGKKKFVATFASLK